MHIEDLLSKFFVRHYVKVLGLSDYVTVFVCKTDRAEITQKAVRKLMIQDSQKTFEVYGFRMRLRVRRVDDAKTGVLSVKVMDNYGGIAKANYSLTEEQANQFVSLFGVTRNKTRYFYEDKHGAYRWEIDLPELIGHDEYNFFGNKLVVSLGSSKVFLPGALPVPADACIFFGTLRSHVDSRYPRLRGYEYERDEVKPIENEENVQTILGYVSSKLK